MNSTWNPKQYEKFKAQRAKPFYDLMNLVKKTSIESAIDLGCGTGELTRALFDQLKPKHMLGIDSSPEMLSESKKFETSELKFKLESISSFNPGQKFDLVFSNAALQWLPDHEELFSKVLSWVVSGGQVAIQMPYNFDHPSHRIAKEVANKLFPAIFAKAETRAMLPLERYAEILFKNGFKNPTARIEVYGHAMDSSNEVIEWTKGTLLTGYQSKLSEDQFREFLQTYSDELIKEIGTGSYFYAFKRMLLWGEKRN